MAEEIQNKSHKHESGCEEVESTDRGLFGLTGKKEEKKLEQEDVITEPFKEQARVPEPGPVKAEEPIKEEEKEHGATLLELIHKDDVKSIPNSSPVDEKAENGIEKKRSVEELSVPVETSNETAEKKGFLGEVKEKLPGHHEDKKPEETAIPTTDRAVECKPPAEEGEGPEKKSVMDKIKEKLPGHHAKTGDTEKA